MSEYEGILQLLSWVLIVGGTFFVVIGAIGTLRFPDFWARLHAASVTESAGVILLLAGLCLHCLLYTSPSPRDATLSRMPSSA